MWHKLWILILMLLLAACSGAKQLTTAPIQPAGDNFRSDTSTRVAQTGKPQLVELWADW